MEKKHSIGSIISLFFLIILIIGVVYAAISINKNECPFTVSKILVISTGEGEQKEYIDENWTLSLTQNNDIYLYIDKYKNRNGNTNKLKNITIENFKVLSGPETTKIEEYLLNDISDNSGVLGFRQTNKDITTHVYAATEIVQSGKLLQTAGITEEQLNTIIAFDVIIETNSAKYKTNITIEVSAKDLLEQGKGIVENTNLGNIVFDKI